MDCGPPSLARAEPWSLRDRQILLILIFDLKSKTFFNLSKQASDKDY